MSDRMTDREILYEIASDLERGEYLCKVRFSDEEKQCLREYLRIYRKRLDLLMSVWNNEGVLSPRPKVNDITVSHKVLSRHEVAHLDEELQRLEETAILQNILNYRFPNRNPYNIQISKEPAQNATKRQKVPKKKEARHKRMPSIKDKLTNTFGMFGTIIYFLINAIVYILPFVMIGGNFFLTSLLLGINAFIPLASAIFWLWGLVCAIKGIQDVWAIIYYIAFAVIWVPFYISSIFALFSKNK